jgi:uncharacterized protein (DUF885 family)
MSDFKHLADRILDAFWRNSPSAATFAGIHTYDHQLDNVNRDFLMDANREFTDFLSELEKLNAADMSDEQRVDWLLLKNFLHSNVKSFEEIRHWETNAAEYASLCVDAIHILLLREYAPLEDRAHAVLSRVRQIPRFLNDVRNNLKNAPAVFTQLAMEITEGGIAFLGSLVPQLSTMEPGFISELDNATADASEALERFAIFLKNELLPESRGEFAIGSELFNFKLKTDHMLPYDAEEILAYGYAVKKSTKTALEDAARKIDRRSSWVAVVDDIKKEHPNASELLETYRREMERAREFVQAKDLVTLPPSEELEVITTPPYYRPVLPYAAYMNPAPFEDQQKGYFFVTPVDTRLPDVMHEETLRGHPSFGIPVTALHEGYPGHHLQLVHANYLQNKLRRLLHTNVFIEGWALYCEEMMYDAGFYSDPRSRLLQLKDQLWRACRVIIDVGLHTKTMNYDQAVELLVNDAKLERVHAQKEVTRYTYTPTQPMSYLIGKKQILELKKDYQRQCGKNFNLKEFHDILLSFGSIPVCLIRRALGL